MGLGQPDMKWKCSRLRSEPKEQTERGRVNIFAPAGIIEFTDGKSPCLLVQQEESHQHHQAADHCHRQICGSRPEGFSSFILRHPDIGSKGHHLKKYKSRIQIRRQKDRFGRPQRDQLKHIVTVSVPVMRKIFRGKQ